MLNAEHRNDWPWKSCIIFVNCSYCSCSYYRYESWQQFTVLMSLYFGHGCRSIRCDKKNIWWIQRFSVQCQVSWVWWFISVSVSVWRLFCCFIHMAAYRPPCASSSSCLTTTGYERNKKEKMVWEKKESATNTKTTPLTLMCSPDEACMSFAVSTHVFFCHCFWNVLTF